MIKAPLPIRPKHKLGQNFLTDANVLEKIIHYFNPAPEDHVLEIGAGTGSLTLRLAGRVERLVAVEIDSLLIPALKGIEGVEVLHGDILKTDSRSLLSGKLLRVIGNLPYYISSAVALHLMEQRDALQDMVLMFQDEVAHRILSAPSREEYGYLSVVAQYYCRIDSGFRVSHNCFFPKPQVESRVLRFEFARDLPVAFDEFTKFVGLSFSQRRKKLRNNLLRGLQVDAPRLDRVFEELGISETARAENLTAAQYEKLILQLR